jgi:hypothetical protein
LLAQLRSHRAHLDSLRHCRDTRCLHSIQPERIKWDEDIQALREVVASQEPPTIRGLAIAQVRHWEHDFNLLDMLDGCVDSTESSGAIPGATGTGQGYEQSVVWESLTLGDLCLRTANWIISNDLSREEYHAWRIQYPNARESVQLRQRVFESADDYHTNVLDDLERFSPALYVRTVLTLPISDELPEDIAQRVFSCLPGVVTPDELLTFIDRPSRWPELADPERHHAFVRNVLVHWRLLLGAQAAPQLGALWDRGFGKGTPLRGYLAWAVAEAIPQRRRRTLESALALPDTPQDRILDALAAEFPREEALVLSKQMQANASNGVAIFQGLARARPAPRRLFRALLDLSSPDSSVVNSAVTAARALGCNLPEGACVGISVRVSKFGSVEQHTTEWRRAEKACGECIAELKRCSSGW